MLELHRSSSNGDRRDFLLPERGRREDWKALGALKDPAGVDGDSPGRGDLGHSDLVCRWRAFGHWAVSERQPLSH